MKNIYETNRRVKYLKYCSDKINEIKNERIEEVPFVKKEIDSYYQELNPETLYLEKEEYEFLNYIIETKLSKMEREIVKNIFGFYGNICSISKTASKLKISVRMAHIIRTEAFRKIKMFLNSDIIVNQKSKKH